VAEKEGALVSAKKSDKKWILYTIAVTPVIAVLTSFLIVKVVNPLLVPPTREDSSQSSSHKLSDRKDGFLCDVGTILVNPYGVDRRRIIKIGILVEVSTESLVKKIERLVPKLKHQAVMVLSSKDLESISSPEGKTALQGELIDAFINELGLGLTI